MVDERDHSVITDSQQLKSLFLKKILGNIKIKLAESFIAGTENVK